MKSKKAKEFISRIKLNPANVNYCVENGIINGSLYFDIKTAVEIAEQEADARIKDKAEKAFQSAVLDIIATDVRYKDVKEKFLKILNK